MEVIEWRLVGEIVGVKVLVKVAVGLEIHQSVHLVWWLWSSSQSQTHNLGWVSSSGGGVAAAGRLLGSIQDVGLRYTVPDGLVGGVEVFLVSGPGLAAGDRLRSVGATGWRSRRRDGATEGAVTEGGDARAGAARQGAATAIQGGRWTGGRGRNRVEGRLGGRQEGPQSERHTQGPDHWSTNIRVTRTPRPCHMIALVGLGGASNSPTYTCASTSNHHQ